MSTAGPPSLWVSVGKQSQQTKVDRLAESMTPMVTMLSDGANSTIESMTKRQSKTLCCCYITTRGCFIIPLLVTGTAEGAMVA